MSVMTDQHHLLTGVVMTENKALTQVVLTVI